MIPVIARGVSKHTYIEEEKFLVFRLDDLYVQVEPRKVSISSLPDAASAARAMQRVDQLLTELVERAQGQAA